MALRPFDRDDWFAWAGCESDEPWIGYVKSRAYRLYGPVRGVFVRVYQDAFVVLVDGCCVCLVTTTPTGDLLGQTNFECGGEREALALGQALANLTSLELVECA